ncbi:MAG TPA: SpoIVB peptidase S55 domain-containing protein, partial [Chthonomonadales bacterium]|nr:SpoIVB peptidase S55 domain-containing protein [Chthonomonadales bacterium]
MRLLLSARRLLLAVGAAIAAAFLGSVALASVPRFPDIMPLSRVHAGMTGYGLTTFHGTTISRFQVTVLGILKKENAGHDLILIRMKGGPITERGANLIHGMSGSPIYIDGKLIGAFSMGEEFPKEPLGMVTPIEDMLDSWDPNIPQRPEYFEPAIRSGASGRPAKVSSAAHIDLPRPILIGTRRITKVVLDQNTSDGLRSSEGTAVMRRASSLMAVSGINERDRKWLQAELNKRGYDIILAKGPMLAAGGGTGSRFNGGPLRPGSAFGTFLVTGDVEVGGTGTVTYRRGNRILGFGHPLMGLGALEGAITSAYIVDVFPGVQTSHYIAVAGPTIGSLTQDRDFSVSADVGRLPHLIPFDVTVRDDTSHRTQTFHTSVFQHPDLTPLLMRMIARETISRVHSAPGDVMARVSTTVDAAEVGSINRCNLVFDSGDIATAAGDDLNQITNIVSGNPFYPLPIRSARMNVEIYAGHDTASLERIYLRKSVFAPGDTVDVGVVLKPYRREEVTKQISITLPSDTPAGRYQLMVRGGMASVLRIGPFVVTGASPDADAPPINVRQMVQRL